MRSISFFLLLSHFVLAIAQKPATDNQNLHSWEVENGKLEWSKIYFADDRSIEEFLKALTFVAREVPILKIERKDATMLRGTFSNLTLEFEKYGYDLINTPFLISRARHSGTIEIDVKEGRYRVKISEVTSFLNKVSRTKSVYVWNDDFIDKKGQVIDEMLPVLEIANKNFSGTFSAKLAAPPVTKK